MNVEFGSIRIPEASLSSGKAEEIVASETSKVTDMDVPEELQTRIVRQNSHLIELANSLLASGLDEDTIKAVVREAMASYERELIQTILALKAESEYD